MCKESGLRGFLGSTCTAIGSDEDRPVPLPMEMRHIGNRSTHSSHKLCCFRGLIYCSSCGMRGPSKLVNLSLPCTEPSEYGRRNLAAINAGMLPEQLEAWPDESVPLKKIDRTHKGRDSDPPPSFLGVRIKRPKTIFNPAGLSYSAPYSSDRPALSPAEQALPPYLLNLFELSSLESNGIAVNWPDGLTTSTAHQLIFDFFDPMIEREEPKLESEEVPSPDAPVCPSSDSFSESFLSNLKDLVSLHDAGEPVVWPDGFTVTLAQQLLSQHHIYH